MFETNDTAPEFTSVVTPPPAAPTDAPQFATAEYAHIPGTEHCRICGNLVSGEYYRINSQMACATCAHQVQAASPIDSHAAYVRGLLLGIGAAIVGLIAYATFTIATGWYLGYIALGVGWFVAKAISKGSNGIGGRRFQITAVLLTYAAISMAAVPIGISYAIKHKTPTAAKSASENSLPGDAQSNHISQAPKHPINWASAIAQLALVGLASPFMELANPFHGVIGLFILFIGLRIARTMTAAKPLYVDGPYSMTVA
ncbi:hypothetical protein [Acidicapsa ligni]|uniref:hypothetical protein n=1 Tax=Acidicapsa ligni TaxID=542300 RepID=UPI0021DF6CAC|nr:hypothetical protein [Acidicapsa ligni]